MGFVTIDGKAGNMTESTKKRSQKAGLPPGALVHIGDRFEERSRITVINYGEEEFSKTEVETAEKCAHLKGKAKVCWVNLTGIHEAETIERIGQIFDLHPLLLEDIMNTDQRPKIEAYDSYLFVVLKTISYDEKEKSTIMEQISIVLGSDYVLSFQERETSIFDPLLEHLTNGKGRIRKMGADYLVYSLIDMIIDNYFLILEQLGERVDSLEVQLVTSPKTETLKSIQRLKREMIFLRRSVWPLREVINSMEREESPLIQSSTYVYLRDIYDHTIQAIDTIETYRDMLSGMLDIYLSSVSYKLNEIMKVLTVVSTIFIPLTFIVGLYGMNFEFMPELKSPWGYPSVLLLMLVISLSMLYYFKRKKWF
jgi:magnesium transporter